MYVAFLSDEAAVAHTPDHWVTHPVSFRRTVARLHAVVTEISLRTELRAVVSGVSGRAATVAVVGPAGGVRRAATRLRARRAPPPRAARRLARRALPARQALARARNIVTIGAILTRALLLAPSAVSAKWAGIFARHTSKAVRASVHASYRIASRVTIRIFGANLCATRAVVSGRAGRGAVDAGPARGAHAPPGRRVARRVVPARTLLRTMLPVTTLRTLRLTSHTSPRAIAEALSGDVITAVGIFRAVAAMLAAEPEEPGRAAPVAARARVPRPAYTLAVNRVAGRIIFTITWLPTI